MKIFLRKYVMFMLIVLLASCAKDDEVSIVNFRFTHDIPNCQITPAVEATCIEYIEFIDESRADVLIGGGDTGYRLNYHRNGNEIMVTGINLDISFRIQDKRSLVRIQDNTIWKAM